MTASQKDERDDRAIQLASELARFALPKTDWVKESEMTACFPSADSEITGICGFQVEGYHYDVIIRRTPKKI